MLNFGPLLMVEGGVSRFNEFKIYTVNITMPLFRYQIYCSIFRTVPGNYTRLRRSFQILAHVKSQRHTCSRVPYNSYGFDFQSFEFMHTFYLLFMLYIHIREIFSLQDYDS